MSEKNTTVNGDTTYPFFIKTKADKEDWDNTPSGTRHSMEKTAQILLEEYSDVNDTHDGWDLLSYGGVATAMSVGI